MYVAQLDYFRVRERMEFEIRYPEFPFNYDDYKYIVRIDPIMPEWEPEGLGKIYAIVNLIDNPSDFFDHYEILEQKDIRVEVYDKATIYKRRSSIKDRRNL
jgi:hypothetical protein